MKPLLSNEDIEKMCSRWLPRLAQDWDVAWKIREIYEEDRKKKDELIQRAVDAMRVVCDYAVKYDDCPYVDGEKFLADALAQGYKPSER